MRPDPTRCLLAFPNDFFTDADPATDTGRRINLSPLATPRNAAGKPIHPPIVVPASAPG